MTSAAKAAGRQGWPCTGPVLRGTRIARNLRLSLMHRISTVAPGLMLDEIHGTAPTR